MTLIAMFKKPVNRSWKQVQDMHLMAAAEELLKVTKDLWKIP